MFRKHEQMIIGVTRLKISKPFSIDNQRKIVDRGQGELLISIFHLYEDTAKDLVYVIDAIKKKIAQGDTLEQIELQVASEHIKQQIGYLQDADGFIDSLLEKKD